MGAAGAICDGVRDDVTDGDGGRPARGCLWVPAGRGGQGDPQGTIAWRFGDSAGPPGGEPTRVENDREGA